MTFKSYLEDTEQKYKILQIAKHFTTHVVYIPQIYACPKS